MAFVHPPAQELFGDTRDPERLAEKDAAFKASIDEAFAAGLSGRSRLSTLPGGAPAIQRTQSVAEEADAFLRGLSPDAAKALGFDLNTIRQSLETNRGMLADIGKDITLSNGVGGVQPVAFDLEAPAKMLAPRPTPTRNRVPRTKGVGTSHRFKQILAFTGTPGMASVSPGFAAPSQTNWNLGGANNQFLIRPPKLGYTAADKLVPYVQMGVSDQVDWGMQFAAQGYQDIRALSQTAVLWSSMIAEDKAILYGRSPASISGYTGSGALAAPASVTATQRAAAAGEVGATGTPTVWIQVTSDAGDFGESVPCTTLASVTLTAGNVVDITVGTDAAGALGYRVYVGSGASDPGTAAHFYQGRTGYKVYTLFASTGSLLTGTATPPAADTSAANANMYDGMIPTIVSQGGGYVSRLNAALATGGSAGSEFNAAFAFLWDPGLGGILADPDEILMNGSDRKQQSQALLSGSTTQYRVEIREGQQDAMVGVMATTVVNGTTGKQVPMVVEPWMPQGNAIIPSWTLPVPDSQVSNVWEVVNVQDYMGVAWPVIQMTYDYSSYWFGALCCFAAKWNGLIQGIKRV